MALLLLPVSPEDVKVLANFAFAILLDLLQVLPLVDRDQLKHHDAGGHPSHIVIHVLSGFLRPTHAE